LARRVKQAHCRQERRDMARWRFLLFFILALFSIYFYNIKPLYAGIDFISFRREQIPEQKKALAEKFLTSVSPYSDYLRFRFATEAFWMPAKLITRIMLIGN